MRRQAPSITTPRLIAAAVAIVNQEGAPALTIRRLAADCGLSPMAVYRHVRDKDDLLDRVVEQVVAAGLPELDARQPWRTRLRRLFHSMRELFLDHPGVAVICVSRPTPVAAVARFYDQVIAALLEGGCSAAEAVHAFDTLLLFTFGSVLWQIPRTETERERLVRLALQQPEQAPHLVQHAASLVRRDPREYFDYGLETILTGVVAQADPELALKLPKSAVKAMAGPHAKRRRRS